MAGPILFGTEFRVFSAPPLLGTFVLVSLRYHRHAGALNGVTWERNDQEAAVEGKNIDGNRAGQRVIVNLDGQAYPLPGIKYTVEIIVRKSFECAGVCVASIDLFPNPTAQTGSCCCRRSRSAGIRRFSGMQEPGFLTRHQEPSELNGTGRSLNAPRETPRTSAEAPRATAVPFVTVPLCYSRCTTGGGTPNRLIRSKIAANPSGQQNLADDRPGFTAKRPVRADRLSLENDHGFTGRTLESPSAPR